MSASSQPVKLVYIVPHTHWDREWYLPFQKFRFKLVKLIDTLLEILESEPYCFTLDGQTILLEDYFEVRSEQQERLLAFIRAGKIQVGPWYILPDIWLVGQESLIRNLEYSVDLAKRLDITLMPLAYLPDMFGHSRAIPQIIGDLTDFTTTMLWRGVPHEITSVPFYWKSHPLAKKSILAAYLPFGYGNAAKLSGDPDLLKTEIIDLVNQLEQFSPIPVYLLQHGTDHQAPNMDVERAIPMLNIPGYDIKITTLDQFMDNLQSIIVKSDYNVSEYAGEFRSSARANLLQDTYSTRMWIKIWNQRVEDLLVHYAEPLSAYTWFYFKREYPTGFLREAWKWHLRNQPHDSICGCSADQTHEEMKSRYFWAESLAESVIENALDSIPIEPSSSNRQPKLLIFNPTNCNDIPIAVSITKIGKEKLTSIKTNTGLTLPLQELHEQSDSYITTLFLTAWGFTEIHPSTESIEDTNHGLVLEKDQISNSFLTLTFNKDGTFDITDHTTETSFPNLHIFEDWGDRGDEYTFGRLGPEFARISDVKRTTIISGPILVEIRQNLQLELYHEVDKARKNRIGKTRIPVETIFRIYRDIPRIDMKTTMTNITRDHRLRICFDLPFSTSETITSTHFGHVRRKGDPEKIEPFIEQPSGIQPQKRFIRVEDDKSDAAVTLFNKGLPEVELVQGSRFALTLIRAVGWLSRSDFPERSNHAGPFLATPGAQEMNTAYTLEYSLWFHSKNEPFSRSADHAEMFSLPPMSKTFHGSHGAYSLDNPLIQLDNPNIRISSLRVREEVIYATVFNLTSEMTETQINFPSTLRQLEVLTVQGRVKTKYDLDENPFLLQFAPFEIKLCRITE